MESNTKSNYAIEPNQLMFADEQDGSLQKCSIDEIVETVSAKAISLLEEQLEKIA